MSDYPRWHPPAQPGPAYQPHSHAWATLTPQGFGSQSQPPPNGFPPPQRRRRILVAVVVALALLAGAATIVVAGYRDSREVAEQARAAKESTDPPPANYSTSASEIAFDYEDNTGTIRLNNHEWRGSTLIANVTVTITEGGLGFTFGGWGIDESYALAEDSTAPPPRLDASYLEAGESATGNISLEFEERGTTTLQFNDVYHDPITALAIP